MELGEVKYRMVDGIKAPERYLLREEESDYTHYRTLGPYAVAERVKVWRFYYSDGTIEVLRRNMTSRRVGS